MDKTFKNSSKSMRNWLLLSLFHFLFRARKEALENDKIDQYLAQQGGGGGASQAPQGADAGTKPADKADAKTKAKEAEVDLDIK